MIGSRTLLSKLMGSAKPMPTRPLLTIVKEKRYNLVVNDQKSEVRTLFVKHHYLVDFFITTDVGISTAGVWEGMKCWDGKNYIE